MKRPDLLVIDGAHLASAESRLMYLVDVLDGIGNPARAETPVRVVFHNWPALMADEATARRIHILARQESSALAVTIEGCRVFDAVTASQQYGAITAAIMTGYFRVEDATAGEPPVYVFDVSRGQPGRRRRPGVAGRPVAGGRGVAARRRCAVTGGLAVPVLPGRSGADRR
jgi:hypothetical protein